MDHHQPIVNIDELAAMVADGSSLVAPTDANGVPMAATGALIRRGAKNLHLIGGPTCGLMADWLIGAGCVAGLETAAVTLGEYGGAPRFRAAVENGRLRVQDTTCPALHAGLQAAEKGVPFMPLRGLIGSDLVRHRPDWRTINNPFAEDSVADPIVLIPAITPDIALFHAPRGDRHGNVWVGLRRELMTMAHAARHSLVTVETLVDGNLLDDPVTAAGTVPNIYIDAVAEADHGAWPLAFADLYPADDAHMKDYVAAARTQDGFDAYLDRTVFGAAMAAE